MSLSRTGIEWATHVWNPVTGCTAVGEGCRNCYAKALHDMRHKALNVGKKLPDCYRQPFETVKCHTDRLPNVTRRQKPKRIFVNSMSDLFHEDVPDEFIDRVFWSMAICTQHIFVILTKRSKRMRKYVSAVIARLDKANCNNWPLSNVWLGFSAWDQESFDVGVVELLQTPAAVRLVSLEPLLGPVDLEDVIFNHKGENHINALECDVGVEDDSLFHGRTLDWVIVGGESGKNARPMYAAWLSNVRDQCVAAKTPFFFKQWSDCRVGIKRAGRLLDGREWNGYPERATRED